VLATRRHRERGRHGHGPMARLRDDAGAVAILVALSVSTFLLGFAALAVDFGQVYMRQGELQSVADAVALAGATELPDIPDARRKAIESLCSPANRLGGLPPDTCPTDLTTVRWANDGIDANGEILFYGEPDELGEFAPPPLTDEDDEAAAIQVKLPPSTVRFGLARTFGADDLEVSKAATARVGTPIGTGFLPFAVTTQDLEDDSRNRQFCVTDLDVDGGTGLETFPGATGGFFGTFIALDFDDRVIGTPTSGRELTVRPAFGRFPTGDPFFVIVGGRRITVPPEDHTDRQATFTLDFDLAPGRHEVWVEAGNPRSFVSHPASLRVFGLAGGGPASDDACDRLGHGVLDIARDDARGVDENNDVLSDNIKQGIEPTPHRVMDRPNNNGTIIPDLTAALIGTTPCSGGLLDFLLGAVFEVLASVLGGDYEDHINCVDTRDRGFEPGLKRGLLDTDGDSPGRLLRRCSGDTADADGVTIDGTNLQQVTDENATRGLPPITEIIENGDVARAAIAAKAFECPRLGIVPVINPGATWPPDGSQYPILDFVYVWIQDDAKGLIFEDGGNRLLAVKFWIIDPGFFGRTVSGSPKVGPYLGPQFPREVLLVKNPGEN
jgi:hypothetical protein